MVYLSLDKLDDRGQYQEEIVAAENVNIEFNKVEERLTIIGKVDDSRRLYASLELDEIPRELQVAIVEKNLEHLSDLILMILQLVKEVKGVDG